MKDMTLLGRMNSKIRVRISLGTDTRVAMVDNFDLPIVLDEKEKI
jgi:hypothetical protein